MKEKGPKGKKKIKRNTKKKKTGRIKNNEHAEGRRMRRRIFIDNKEEKKERTRERNKSKNKKENTYRTTRYPREVKNILTDDGFWHLDR